MRMLQPPLPPLPSPVPSGQCPAQGLSAAHQCPGPRALRGSCSLSCSTGAGRESKQVMKACMGQIATTQRGRGWGAHRCRMVYMKSAPSMSPCPNRLGREKTFRPRWCHSARLCSSRCSGSQRGKRPRLYNLVQSFHIHSNARQIQPHVGSGTRSSSSQRFS